MPALFTRRNFLRAAAAALSFAFLQTPAFAADYKVLPVPQPVSTGKKIEVMEVFSYMCPHCNALEPKLEAWAKHLPKDVELKHMPAVFREDWLPAAKTYYTLEAMGLDAHLHAKVYDAIHLDQFNFTDPNVIFDWMAKHGVDRKAFVATYNSFTVQSDINRANIMTAAYQVTGVPSIVVDGKYMTSVSMTGNEQNLFKVVDQLIAKARKERAHH